MNKDYIYSMICEMAQADGLDARDFVEQLYAQRNYPSVDGLPEEVAAELSDSRRMKNDERYRTVSREKMKGDIAHFRELFPNVVPDAVPDEVWLSVSEGTPLAAAYALYEKESTALRSRAKGVNEENGKISTTSASFVSPQEIEKMTPAEVKKNYRRIIASMKKW